MREQLRNFLAAKLILSHMDLSRQSKDFYKEAAPLLDQALEKIDVGIVFRTRIIGLQIRFAGDFVAGTIRKWW